METPYDLYKQNSYFGSLDGLRCLAIIGVVWQHTCANLLLLPLAHRGNVGVQIFFVISGFLISTLFLREKERSGGISLKRFYLRRVLRIMPLYYAVLLTYVVLIVGFEQGSATERREFVRNLPFFLSYTTNWFVNNNFDGRVAFYLSWALATELQFYAVWPFIEKYAKGILPAAVAVLLLVLSEALRQGLFDTWIASDMIGYTIVGKISSSICLGVILGYLLHYRRGFNMAYRFFGRRFCGPVAMVLLIGMLCLPRLYHLSTYCVIAVLVGSCVVREDHFLSPLLKVRIVRHIGAVSYGIYLMHMLAFNIVKLLSGKINVRHDLLNFIGTLVVATVIATISHRYFEAVFLRWKDRFAATAGGGR
jgi:peptidoglycan/LPS O-acetylase OafA/YrhL